MMKRHSHDQVTVELHSAIAFGDIRERDASLHEAVRSPQVANDYVKGRSDAESVASQSSAAKADARRP